MSNIKETNGTTFFKWITFSDGSETCEVVAGWFNKRNISLECVVEDCNRDVIRLGLVKDVLDRLDVTVDSLTLKYVPQARADRVFSDVNPHPLKVFCNIINSYGYKKVVIYDPHSDVTPALLNNVEVVTQSEVLNMHLPLIRKVLPKFTLVSPDLGASKKIFDSVQMLQHEDYYQAIKIRDTSTGNIVKCSLIEESVQGDVLIVDDICDGGASFIHLASLLKERGASKVGLFVTHGIFSKGVDILKENIDYIFVEGIVGKYITRKDIENFNSK